MIIANSFIHIANPKTQCKFNLTVRVNCFWQLYIPRDIDIEGYALVLISYIELISRSY